MVEREDRAPVGTFYAPGAWRERAELDDGAAHHAQVKRLAVGHIVRLSSGDGRRAIGAIVVLLKRRLVVEIDTASREDVPAPARVDLWVPIGDRDRMLMLAEKSVELGVSSLRPVVYGRSRSVSARGEGDSFREKLRLRMIGALEQCGSAWLPELHRDGTLEVALAADAASREGDRLLLDAEGESIGEVMHALDVPVRLALGPEGGLEEEERVQFIRAGWRTVSLGGNVLRFETAGIAALAIVRSHLR
ncbi:MAG TPA: RsmE family RNA methyltransferase [Gemmatimonadaceae bacterium]